jgi:cell division protein FtsA
MAKNRIVAGIDIGSSKITTIIAQVVTDAVTFENSINVVGVASSPSRGVKKGQIVDIEEAVEATIVSVESAERMAGYNLNSAYVSVGGGHISSINSTGVVAISDPQGEVTPPDVARVIDAARAISQPGSREVIHVIPRQYIVDGESGVRDPIGMTGVRLEVETHIVTASSGALKNLSKTVNEVGIAIEQNVFSGLASSWATLSDTEKELGCVLIDIGAGVTSVAAFIDGSLAYSGALPIGARNVTNDLAIGLRISLEAAEKIKLSLGVPERKDKETGKGSDLVDVSDPSVGENKKVSKRTLVEGIVRPRLNEIFTMIKLDLEKANLINRIPSGAVITGGGAMTVGIADSAKRMLSLPVRISEPKGVGGLIDEIQTPAFSTAVGLILYGASQVPMAPQQSGFGKKIKLPSGGFIGKVLEKFSSLLP